MRRLPPGAQASAEQVEAHRDAVRAHELVDRDLPEGFTYVRRHRRAVDVPVQGEESELSDLVQAASGTAWWNADDVTEVTERLASRRSRLWQLVAPADLAAWVFAEPAPAPLDPSPGAFDGDWVDGLDEAGRAAWAFAGWAARLVVPEAASTAGKHWLLSRLDDTAPAVLRLTVGVLEILGLYESGEGVWLRAHAGPIVLAM